jgi:hypothetical protein
MVDCVSLSDSDSAISYQSRKPNALAFLSSTKTFLLSLETVDSGAPQLYNPRASFLSTGDFLVLARLVALRTTQGCPNQNWTACWSLGF